MKKKVGIKIVEEISPFASELVFALLDSTQFDCKLVGGVVRDLLLDVKVKDVDFVLNAEESKLNSVFEEIFAFMKSYDRSHYKISKSERIKDFRTFKIAFDSSDDNFEFDFVFTRKENYSGIGARPTVEPGTMIDDLLRRDFSINAMATKNFENPLESIIDNFNGVEDIAKKQIKVLHDLSFRDDPSRLIRAVKFKNRFGFQLESNTARLFKEAVEQAYLPNLSSGRRYSEFLKLFSETKSIAIFEELLSMGLLVQLFENEGFAKGNQIRDYLQNSQSLNEKDFFKYYFLSITKDSQEKILKNFPISKVIKKSLNSL